jgi:hypothetical protein
LLIVVFTGFPLTAPARPIAAINRFIAEHN